MEKESANAVDTVSYTGIKAWGPATLVKNRVEPRNDFALCAKGV